MTSAVHKGHTLTELVVTLAILGILFGIIAVSVRARPSPNEEKSFASIAAEARRHAIRSGHSVTVRDSSSGRELTAFADGRVVTSAKLMAEMSGAANAR